MNNDFKHIEQLIVSKFGPIKNIDLQLREVNLFIGDQGSGKSTIAKLFFAIKETILKYYFNIDNEEAKSLEELFLNCLELVGIKQLLEKDTQIVYHHKFYSLIYEKQKINFNLISHKNNLLDKLYDNNYIPAERNMISVLADSIYALLELKADLPKSFTRFGTKFQKARKKKVIFNYKDILGISYSYKSGKDIIITPDGNEINLSDASSGIQGSVVWLIVFDEIMSEIYISNGNFNDYLLSKNSKLLVIEEPELNCFPETQNKILKYIIENNILKSSDVNYKLEKNSSSFINLKEYENYNLKNQLLITTHSPYILTSLNNLIYAFNLAKDNFEETNKIIPSKYWLNPNHVSVYKLINGESVSIIDEELKQIKVEEIDEISEVLSNQWHEMAELNLVKH
jgi:hypothetical protein